MTMRDIIYLQSTPSSRGGALTLIMREVCEKHGVTLAELRGVGNQTADMHDARYEAFYRVRVEVNLSYPRIGHVMGGFHHTTVMHGIQKHTDLHGLPCTHAGNMAKRGAETPQSQPAALDLQGETL